MIWDTESVTLLDLLVQISGGAVAPILAWLVVKLGAIEKRLNQAENLIRDVLNQHIQERLNIQRMGNPISSCQTEEQNL